MSGAMVYMLVAVSRPALAGGTGGGPADAMGIGTAAASGIRFPLLAIFLAQFMAAYVMWAADRLPALAPVRAWRASPVPLAAATPEPSPAGAAGPSPARQPTGPPLAGAPPSAGAQPAGPWAGRVHAVARPARGPRTALPPAGRLLQHRDGHRHGLHAGHHALSRTPGPPNETAAPYRSSAARRAGAG